MRIISLNTNGLRSAAKKGFFDYLSQCGADVVCIQETKAQEADLADRLFHPEGWHVAFQSAVKKGYSGVAIYSRRQPDVLIRQMGVPEFDDEGRYLEARFGDFTVISLYLPSGSSGPERQASKDRFLSAYPPIKAALRNSGQRVVVCGDYNIAHAERDLRNWKGNQKNSGFLPHERAWMTTALASGWVDAYRSLYPSEEANAYTWWSNRGNAYANNVGWRIDYQLCKPNLRPTAAMVFKETRFSDHAPLVIDYV